MKKRLAVVILAILALGFLVSLPLDFVPSVISDNESISDLQYESLPFSLPWTNYDNEIQPEMNCGTVLKINGVEPQSGNRGIPFVTKSPVGCFNDPVEWYPSGFILNWLGVSVIVGIVAGVGYLFRGKVHHA